MSTGRMMGHIAAGALLGSAVTLIALKADIAGQVRRAWVQIGTYFSLRVNCEPGQRAEHLVCRLTRPGPP